MKRRTENKEEQEASMNPNIARLVIYVSIVSTRTLVLFANIFKSQKVIVFEICSYTWYNHLLLFLIYFSSEVMDRYDLGFVKSKCFRVLKININSNLIIQIRFINFQIELGSYQVSKNREIFFSWVPMSIIREYYINIQIIEIKINEIE